MDSLGLLELYVIMTSLNFFIVIVTYTMAIILNVLEGNKEVIKELCGLSYIFLMLKLIFVPFYSVYFIVMCLKEI